MAKRYPTTTPGYSKDWLRQIEAHGAGEYESEQHGIWEDRIGRSDRNPMLHLVAQLRRGGVDVWGNRKRQSDPVLVARAMVQREATRNQQFRQLWNAATPAMCNALVEAIAINITK